MKKMLLVMIHTGLLLTCEEQQQKLTQSSLCLLIECSPLEARISYPLTLILHVCEESEERHHPVPNSGKDI